MPLIEFLVLFSIDIYNKSKAKGQSSADEFTIPSLVGLSKKPIEGLVLLSKTNESFFLVSKTSNNIPLWTALLVGLISLIILLINYFIINFHTSYYLTAK